MAFTMTNVSLHGNTYKTTITPTDSTIPVTSGTLIPSADPLTFDIDDSEDVDTTIREGTGTLSFVNEMASFAGIENYISKFNCLVPATALGTKVECKRGNIVIFTGYIDAELSDQPWDSTPHEVSFQIRDMLSMLKEVDVDATLCDGTSKPFAAFLLEALDAVGLTDFNLVTPCDHGYQEYFILVTQICREWFCSYETNEDGYEELKGMSWFDAISMVLKAYGYTMQMQGSTIIIQGAVYPQMGGMYCLKRSEIVTISTHEEYENDYIVPKTLLVPSKNMFDVFENMSDDNKIKLLPPYKKLIVKQTCEAEGANVGIDSGDIDWSCSYTTSTNGNTIRMNCYATTHQSNLKMNYRNASGEEVKSPGDIWIWDGNYGARIGDTAIWSIGERVGSPSPSANVWLFPYSASAYVVALELTAKYCIRNGVFNAGGLCFTAHADVCNDGSVYSTEGYTGSLKIAVTLGDKLRWTSGYGWMPIDDGYAGGFDVLFEDGEIVSNRVEDWDHYLESERISLSMRAGMQDASGYVMPFTKYAKWVNQVLDVTPKLTVYCPTGVVLKLSNMSLNYCKLGVSNGDKEKKYTQTLGDAGEDLEIELDNWNESSWEPTTFQPLKLPRSIYDNYNACSALCNTRKLLSLDNVYQPIFVQSLSYSDTEVIVAGSGSLSFLLAAQNYIYPDSYAVNRLYMMLGRSYSVATDSGKVTLVSFARKSSK